ncbi:MAG: Hsp20/alpha crystallin family protein [Phycisphaerales bacterium JB039]
MTNTLSRRSPLSVSPLSELFNTLFEDGPTWGIARAEPDLPLDISETDDAYVIRASLPGYKRDEVNVEVHEGVLTISGQHTEEHEETGERYHRRERRYGSVTRRLRLPDDLADTEPQAHLTDGVLEVRLPKAEKTLPRRIEVK